MKIAYKLIVSTMSLPSSNTSPRKHGKLENHHVKDEIHLHSSMLYIVMFVFLVVNLKIGVFADSGLKVQAPNTAPTRVSRHPERPEKQNQSSAVASRTPSKPRNLEYHWYISWIMIWNMMIMIWIMVFMRCVF